jgi:hypothetical protein
MHQKYKLQKKVYSLFSWKYDVPVSSLIFMSSNANLSLNKIKYLSESVFMNKTQ